MQVPSAALELRHPRTPVLDVREELESSVSRTHDDRIGSLTGRVLAFACRPYNANEVFVTGTFDDWGKTVRLDRVGEIFSKEVSLPAGEKVCYKVGIWSFFFILHLSPGSLR